MRRSALRKRRRGAAASAALGAGFRRLAAEALEDRRMLTLSTIDLNAGLTPTDLVLSLLGGGVTVSNVTFTGDNSAGGEFTGGLSEGLDVESGVILSSGNVADATGPNEAEGTTTSFDLSGDPDLDGLIPGFETFDATLLEFDFVGAGGMLSFQYVFGSEEYNEFVDQSFNDVFGFFVDGENIALIPGTNTPVSINNVNNLRNTEFYHDNSPTDLGIPTPFGTQADGFTLVLTAQANISPGMHHIKLAIADAGDHFLDSWVFLAGESFVSGDVDLELTKSDSPDPVIVNNPLTYTVTVTNSGPDPASGVVVEDVLPQGVTFVGASASQGTATQANGVVTAHLGSLVNGASATVRITVIPHEVGTITNTATVDSLQFETDPDDNAASQDTSVEVPKLSINDVEVGEGDVGTRDAVFTVSLNAPDLTSTITVGFLTAAVTATSNTDFEHRVGVLTFAPGVALRTITVPVIGDSVSELGETFLVQLINAVNADIVRNPGLGTILDDDPLPNLYVSDVQLTSTAAGQLAAVFAVALDVPSGREVTVAYATSDGTARDGVDYSSRSGVVTFSIGVTTQLVTVPVMTSADYSSNKRFYLNLLSPIGAITLDPRGAATMVYAPGPRDEFIIDDGAGGYTQSAGWTNLTNTLAYHLDYDYAPAGNGSAAATWSFIAIPNGPYQVFARWIPFGNRATNAPYTISAGATTLGTVAVNQQLPPNDDQSNAITWHSLGTFTTANNKLSVRLANNANGVVVADAVRIVAEGIDPQVPEMDVASFERSISVGDASPSMDDGTDFGQAAAVSGTVTHAFTISNNGNADLHLTGGPAVVMGGAHAADFSVVAQPAAMIGPGKKTTFQVKFRPGAVGLRTATVSIANDDDSEHPYTFAVQGTGMGPPQGLFVVDDSMPGFSTTGNWTTTADAGAYEGQMRAIAASAGSDKAVWNFSGLAAGSYQVYATWVAAGDRATNAPFTVSNLVDNTYTIFVNQRQAPRIAIDSASWGSLGIVDVAGGVLEVSLSNVANGLVVADAVMVIRNGYTPPPPPPPPPALAHNAAWPEDVNADNRVSTSDVLIVINNLLSASLAPAAAPLAAAPAASAAATHYVDVNGDGRVTPIDVLKVINYLLSPPAASPIAAPLAAAPVDQAIALFDDTADAEAVEPPPRVAPAAGGSQAGAAATSAAAPQLLAAAAFGESLAAEEADDPAPFATDLELAFLA
jgi:uncharacterized repeat protein (TIGR01451 family)